MNWQDHENLMLAAGLARRAARPQAAQPDRGFAAAQLLSREGDRGQDVDPLEARLVDQILADRERRQFESQRQADEAQKWERALQMQTRQETRDDRIRGEERAARREDVTGEQGFAMKQMAGQQGFARQEAEAGRTHEDKTYKSRLGAEQRSQNQRAYDQIQSQIAALEAEGAEIPATLRGQRDYYRQALGIAAGAGGDAGAGAPRTPENDVAAVVRANVSRFADDWSDTSAEDLFDNSTRGMMADPTLTQAMDKVIARLLRQGKKPEEIGYMARQAIEGQDIIEPSTLDNPRFMGNDKYATHFYGERWRQRAEQIAGLLAGRAGG